MRIIVCLKQILDPELPPSVFEIDSTAGRAVLDKHPLVISPFDENALELALQLKEKIANTHVTALTYGNPKLVEEGVLRKALGLLVDEAVLVKKESQSEQDAFATARVLAAAIRKLGSADLVLCGRQAGDWDAGLVGFLLAEELDYPCLSFVSQISPAEDQLIFKTEVEAGFELVEAKPPVVATVTNDESNVIRVAKIRDVMMAHRKKVVHFSLAELGLDVAELDQIRAHAGLKDIYIPSQSTVCQFIEGEGPEEKVVMLVDKLRNCKIL